MPENVEVRSGPARKLGSELEAGHDLGKWGFRRLMGSMQRERNALHEDPVRGKEVGVGKHCVAWRVTRDRVLVSGGWCGDDNESTTGCFDSEHPRRVANASSCRTIGQSVDVGTRGGHRLPMAVVQRRSMLSRLHPHNPLQS